MNCVSRPLWAKGKPLGGQLGQDTTTPEMSPKGTKGFWMSPCESVARSQGWGWHLGHCSQPGSRTL